ncbi:hypothetical protein C4K26_2429 [Pseudomonas chlororaphis]|nr:hypothetical protein C4K26_2429 [Pseudomonas chlororaphis]
MWWRYREQASLLLWWGVRIASVGARLAGDGGLKETIASKPGRGG